MRINGPKNEKVFRHVRLFGNTSRFIKDLISLNEKELFEKTCTEIYPPELELKKKNKNNI